MITLRTGKEIAILTHSGLLVMEIVEVVGDRYMIVKVRSPLLGDLYASAIRNMQGRYVKFTGWLSDAYEARRVIEMRRCDGQGGTSIR